jgi:stearoyl-CoA desaturase (delta-9 desaturase)
MFGKREFETRDQSHNEWIVGLLAFGEGWHNNHHAFPRSAFHGLHWWQFDLSGYLIWTLERLCLVYDVYRVPPALLERRSSAKVRAVATKPKGGQ